MSNVLGTLFGNIAAAIREKNGETDKMKPAQFPEMIKAIESASSGTELDAMIDTINGEVINGKVVTFIGIDGSVLCQVSVVPGNRCPDPVLTLLIDAPTKEPTLTIAYVHSGWSMTEGGEADPEALRNIREDRTVYAAFEETTRYYTVRFFDDTKLLATYSVEYGGKAEHAYKKTGYHFLGWNPDPSVVTQDMDCYAQMQMASFYSDDWETIIAAAENGTAKDKYAIGDEKVLTLNYGTSSEKVLVQIVGFGVDERTLTNPIKAGMTIIAKTALKEKMAWNTESRPWEEGSGAFIGSTYDGFDGTTLHTHLEDVVRPAMPETLRNGLKSAWKHRRMGYYGGSMNSISPALFNLWIPSVSEVSGLEGDGNLYRYFQAYPDDNSRIATLYDSGEAVPWWTTTVEGSNSVDCILENGRYSSKTANEASAYVVFGFCI